MSKLPKGCIDLIVTDPPYLVNYKDRSDRTIKNDDPNNAKWLIPAFAQMFRVLKDNSFAVVFYGWNCVDKYMYAWKKAGFKSVGHFVWVKDYDSNARFIRYRHECAYLLIKGKPDIPNKPLPSVMKWRYSGNQYHPMQKPEEILIPLILNLSNKGDVVLDPFSGSGATAVASVLTKRDFLGYELDKKYHAISVKRLVELVNHGVIKNGK
jgi:site-specific DNA-methyltransferase (adenine-specific)